LAEEINRVADKTGVRASFTVQTYGTFAIQDGKTSSDFSINGVIIGQIDYKAADENGQLVSAINAVKDTTGVEAAKDANGKLVLTSKEGRGIVIGGSIGVGSGVINSQYSNFGRLSLVKNSGQDIAISGTGFGFTVTAGDFISQSSVSLRESKGQIEGNMADAMGFFAYPGGNRYIITGFSSVAAFMSSAGSGFSAGSGLSNYAPMKTLELGIADNTAGVTTLKGAMAVMDIAETAILNLDQVRADIGSAQQQLEVTIANISTTQVNVKAAESTIRDVDFASESANFSKQNILAQSGSYALAQANQSQQYVLQLLQ
ncbi:flagellin, partial [Campylobacter sp. MIT 97-5078]|uniref:flagellin n=1 Tax=Campylobacter sp. MIT 97-5078 TaxID=1548153 RepID=UPI0005143329